ncbi:hypothetical protein GCM10011371_10170 [Novosphingobium marinum]|uniref:MarR family transcriptional regulator n=1 Tax=Novosphingobium marinum TaxID=1514948 RepID=A0A7Y9XV97_9SPHN|nr:hypothetical protein [Novosphingobium marinum]GGC24496.1 hypothetical protein GCM10011371_10170 [Novosphingobium marinum]
MVDPPSGRQEAPQAATEHLGRLQRLSLAVVRLAGPQGLTAHETAYWLRIDRATIQPRLSELRSKGRITDSGMRRRNASGRRAIVWVVRDAFAGG